MLIKANKAEKSFGINNQTLASLIDAYKTKVVSQSGRVQDPVKKLKQSLRIIEELQQELRKSEVASYKKGFEEGKKLGFEEGLSSIKKQVNAFTDIIEAINLHQQDLFRGSEQFVVTFALKIVEKMIGTGQIQQIGLDKKLFCNMVENALKEFADTNNYIIRVHKESAELVEQYKSDIDEKLPDQVSISIIEDPSLRQNDCLIETDFGVLDGCIESQLKEIKQIFLKN